MGISPNLQLWCSWDKDELIRFWDQKLKFRDTVRPAALSGRDIPIDGLPLKAVAVTVLVLEQTVSRWWWWQLLFISGSENVPWTLCPVLLCQSVLVDSGVWTARISAAVNTMSVIRSAAVCHAVDIQDGQELTVMKISMNVWTHRTVVITLTVKIPMDQPSVTVIVGTAWWTTSVHVSIEIRWYHRRHCHCVCLR